MKKLCAIISGGQSDDLAGIRDADFIIACDRANLKEDDFIFLDPPYDSEFSTYAQNEFSRKDQERLATFLVNHCPAKWMMIIKNTDFIFELYNKEGIKIKTAARRSSISRCRRTSTRCTRYFQNTE